MRRSLILVVVAAGVLGGAGARADAQLSVIVREGVSLEFSIPDPDPPPPELCGDDPLYHFNFAIERVTTTTPEGESVTYRAGGGDGGCERGGGYGPLALPVVFEFDPLANTIRVVADLGGPDAYDHFEFTMARPSEWSSPGCVGLALCPNAWVDPPATAAGASLGGGIVRGQYEVTFTRYLHIPSDVEIREMRNSAWRVTSLLGVAQG